MELTCLSPSASAPLIAGCGGEAAEWRPAPGSSLDTAALLGEKVWDSKLRTY